MSTVLEYTQNLLRKTILSTCWRNQFEGWYGVVSVDGIGIAAVEFDETSVIRSRIDCSKGSRICEMFLFT